jgi:hypothetical protein
LLAIPALATVVALAGAVRFALWASGRGLDITDEGYYLVSARYPADVVMMVTASHRLLRPLFAAVGWNLPLYRAAGVCLTVLSAFVLAAGLDACRRRLDPDAPRSWTLVASEAAAIALGAMLGYSWVMTPSYNWITNWGLSLGAGAVLTTLTIGEANRAASLWLGVLGAVLGAMFFAKFTAAVAAGGVFALALLLWPLVPFRVRAKWLLPAAVGFVAVVAFYFVVLQSPVAWVRTVRLGLWDAGVQTPLHNAGSLIRYYHDWRDDVVGALFKEFGSLFVALTALAIAIRFAPPDRWVGGRTLRLLAWAGIAYAVYLVSIHLRDFPPSIYHFDVTRLFFGWLLLLGPLALAWRGRPQSHASVPGRQPRIGLAWTIVVLMLFVLPFCGSVGTGNALQFGMRFTLAPWFALFAIVLGCLSAASRTRWSVPVGLACLSAFCIVYIVRGQLEAPYRLLTGLRGQTEETPIGAAGSVVKLDPELHAFITDVRAAAERSGFKPGDDLLGLYDMPGIVFALGGRSPGVTWWTMGYPGSRPVMERAIELAGAERVRHAYILQTKSSTEWLQSLAPKGVNFPGDYVLAGTFTIPYSWAKEEVRLWRPKAR